MKRALMIAFHFPPQAASSGIQRTLSFSKHLGRHGWEPMVVSAHPRAYEAQNPSQLASVPPELVVRRVFALDTKRHLGFRGRYTELLAMPDRWISWWLGAVPAGLALVRSHRPQVIWSTFPVATAHLIGLALHRLSGLPWVADFRDPMLQPTYPESRLARRVYGWIERQAITRCQFAVFTTHSAMQSYRTRFPRLSPDKFVVIENGYDEEGFAGAAPGVSAARPDGRLTLVHSGVLYDTGRDPSCFLQAIAELKQRGAVDAARLRVVLRAPGNVPQMDALVERHGVADIVEVASPVPYREALREMLDADGLLVFQGAQFNAQVPAKVYEYFRARKPILGLVDRAGETAQVLRAGGFDCLAPIDQSDQIAAVLVRFLDQVRRGQAHVAGDALIAASSRAGRACELANVFERACAGEEAILATTGADKR
jgi:glycosyltransferase involved in cell wall biosynthesis